MLCIIKILKKIDTCDLNLIIKISCKIFLQRIMHQFFIDTEQLKSVDTSN